MQSYVCEKEQTYPGIAFVIVVLGVGRVIALFNWLCMKKIVKAQKSIVFGLRS